MSIEPETNPKRRPANTRFASPRGGDADPTGGRVTLYYNPSPGVVAKKQRMKQVAARLFAERGLAAVGLTQVSQAANLPTGTTKYYFRNRDDMLTEILFDHVVALTGRVGAAHDATAEADPATRLAALVQAFHDGVLAAPDAHRALLFSVMLLPAEPQRSVKGRYRALLEIFVETLGQVAPGLAPSALTTSLLPALERLLSGVVFWGGADADAVDPHYPRMVTAMMLAAAHALVSSGAMPALDCDPGADEAPGPGSQSGAGPRLEPAGLLAALSPAVAPAKSGRSFVGRRDDSSVRRSRRSPEVAEPNWLARKEAKQNFDEVLSAAGAGKEFVITCRGWPVARLGPAGECGAPT
jgi:AcrR family transcriptional regulator